MVDENKPSTDKPAPKSMSGRDVAAWLRQGQRKFAKNQVAERAAAETARKNAEANQRAALAEQARQERIAAIRQNESNVAAINVTPGKVASFLWMPQVNLSFRGFGFALSLLVQVFAQALITVGLLPPDHPARTLKGANGFKLFSLLEEARLNLLPFKTVLDKTPSPEMTGLRAFAMRQYIMFSAIMGVIVTGAISIFFGLSRVLFYVSAAHAQSSPTTSSSSQPGLLVGFCPSSTTSTTTTDFASTCLDNIFGTGSTGSTTSLISSGLGTMFSLYSSMVLVFAGIIFLWIIISAVAETARTGVPFGKNFNSVWTPIRLVAALGLLVPLGSGMNSGQYIVIYLAKWGSQQATNIWNGYAQNLVNSSNNGQPISGLTSVSFDEAQARQSALQIMQISLCAAVQNQLCNSGSDCTISPQVLSSITQPNAVGNVSTSGGTATAAQTGTIPTKTGWFVSNGGTPPAKNTAYPDCGSITVTLPSSTSNSTTTGSQSTNTVAQAAQTSAQAILTQSAQNITTLQTSLQNVAKQIAESDYTMINAGDYSNPSYSASQAYSDYNTALTTYLNGQEQTNIPTNLQKYNNALSQALTQLMQQNNGWVSAPVWLLNIIMANGVLEDSVSSAMTITQPAGDIASQFTGTNGASDDSPSSLPSSLWAQVQSTWGQAQGNQATVPSASNATYQSIISPLQSLTQSTSINPLSSAATYGRDLFMLGVFLIQPQNEQGCYTGDASACLGSDSGTTNNIQKLLPNMKTLAQPYPWAETLISASEGSMDNDKNKGQYHAALFPVGMMLISMGIMLIILPMLLLLRFISGILNWIMLIFEAVLAQPMSALSLLSTGGEGFMTQQFQTNAVMLVGIVLRPPLMIIGTVLSIAAFGTIMQIANLIFAPSLQNMPLTSSGALLSIGIYGLIYALMAYTLANSAFKMIDLMPNWVMNWIGARMEQRADDMGGIQQQVAGFTSTLAYSSGRGGTTQTAAEQLHQKVQAAQDQSYAQQHGISMNAGTGNSAPTTPTPKPMTAPPKPQGG